MVAIVIGGVRTRHVVLLVCREVFGSRSLLFANAHCPAQYKMPCDGSLCVQLALHSNYKSWFLGLECVAELQECRWSNDWLECLGVCVGICYAHSL